MKTDTYYLFAPPDDDPRGFSLKAHLSDAASLAEHHAGGFEPVGGRGDPLTHQSEQLCGAQFPQDDESAREALAKFLDTLIPVLEGAVMSGAEWASGSEAPKKDLLQCLKYGINVRVLPDGMCIAGLGDPIVIEHMPSGGGEHGEGTA